MILSSEPSRGLNGLLLDAHLAHKLEYFRRFWQPSRSWSVSFLDMQRARDHYVQHNQCACMLQIMLSDRGAGRGAITALTHVQLLFATLPEEKLLSKGQGCGVSPPCLLGELHSL